ncbi:2'-5' RNA ligase family protein [Microbacterium dauci]|uniref:2'-5' RNA ligase family protein n=1 Tax=Microbacterium dauci TaxID=3048008 RepID=A0ABT6ZFA2_9MICO|nr:2'-5' RNA ligase family protein [Microbacterium sp. LX3-4]MDJ1114302.1 2'-5' RNA ligase family protein [Microbacterium sp. LX3-4]
MRGAPVVSIELLLDDDTERAVRAEWDALAAAGLSSLAAHTAPSNRPHVTLLVRPELGPFAVAERAAFPVVLGAPLLFGSGDRRVLARSVLPSAALLELHAAVHGAAGPGENAPHSAPGEWMPHVTLARRLKVADLDRALPLVGGDLHGRARALRRWDAASATVTDLGGFRD